MIVTDDEHIDVHHMRTGPNVSVPMTVYNGERFVEEAIESILRQTLRELELVIVDDGSDDGTPDILYRKHTDERITVISRPLIGRGRALNLALDNAHGEYVALLDADDVAEPDRLEKQCAYLDTHPEVGAVSGGKRLVYDDERGDRIYTVPLEDAAIRRRLPRSNPMVHTAAMMRRALLEEAGGYNEALKVCVDYKLWIRIAGRTRLANLPDILVTERDHAAAHFRNRVSVWTRLRTGSSVRWQAWRRFPRNPLGLWFVVDPFGSLIWIVRAACPGLRHFYQRHIR